MRHYCTYFDSYYLLRGLTMFRSLQEHAGEFVLWVLCCDEAALQTLQTLDVPNLRPVALSEVEAFDPALARAKINRNRVEYLWTLSPIWPLYLFDQHPAIEQITYLDADLFFFSSPEPIFEEIGANSVAMFAHRFPAKVRARTENGIYNVEWLSFRRDETGLGCLRRWREQCLEWCYDRVEGERYGDQKYLDEWPQLWKGLRIVEHKGAGVAPWNWQEHIVTRRDSRLVCNDVPLIFYHFHGLRFLEGRRYDAVFNDELALPRPMHSLLFDPYLEAMIETAHWARQAGCTVAFGAISTRQYLAAYGKRIFFSKILRRRFIFHAKLE